MDMKYSYLKPHRYFNYDSPVELWKTTIFYPVVESDIQQAEEIITKRFPSELVTFYQNIGYGHLTTPEKYKEDYHFYGANEILPPLVAAHFYQGILEHQIEPKEEALEYDDHWMALSTLEMLELGDLPFFEISDSSSFLKMKLYSDNPNAVWTVSNIKIEDTFEKFIWRLYYEDPEYYGDIIEAHYAQKI